ncbi:hypothetical protein CLV93_11286 [Prolixibacter denitrificans]|uniref:Uncharacterized protein n=1 Tax=Prolixibacter denitrificans TaxID=1541063 RepID=A0A2P8C7L2_9BACT|nr:hypothetical protein CLV93_11286 [Prolixibacter denitrificans]
MTITFLSAKLGRKLVEIVPIYKTGLLLGKPICWQDGLGKFGGNSIGGSTPTQFFFD